MKASEAFEKTKTQGYFAKKEIAKQFEKVQETILEEINKEIECAVNNGNFFCCYTVPEKYDKYIHLIIEKIQYNEYSVKKELKFNGLNELRIYWGNFAFKQQNSK